MVPTPSPTPTAPTPLPAKRTRVSAKAKRIALAADKAVVVLRVSTRQQADSGLGLDAQRAAAAAFCADEGLNMVRVVEDAGVGGSVLPEDRPGMAEALAMLASGAVGVLVAAKADRLTRKNADLYALMDRGAREGWCIRTADRLVDTCSQSGRLMASVAGLFAEQERALIQARTTAALQSKKARGHRLGAPVRTEAGTRNRIRTLRLEGLTMAAVAERLNDEGLLTPSGRRWTWQNVRRVTASLALDDLAKIDDGAR